MVVVDDKGREKTYSDYSGLLGYDTISKGVVPHVPAS
jgi:hypothetical protein